MTKLARIWKLKSIISIFEPEKSYQAPMTRSNIMVKSSPSSENYKKPRTCKSHFKEEKVSIHLSVRQRKSGCRLEFCSTRQKVVCSDLKLFHITGTAVHFISCNCKLCEQYKVYSLIEVKGPRTEFCNTDPVLTCKPGLSFYIKTPTFLRGIRVSFTTTAA